MRTLPALTRQSPQFSGMQMAMILPEGDSTRVLVLKALEEVGNDQVVIKPDPQSGNDVVFIFNEAKTPYLPKTPAYSLARLVGSEEDAHDKASQAVIQRFGFPSRQFPSIYKLEGLRLWLEAADDYAKYAYQYVESSSYEYLRIREGYWGMVTEMPDGTPTP